MRSFGRWRGEASGVSEKGGHATFAAGELPGEMLDDQLELERERGVAGGGVRSSFFSAALMRSRWRSYRSSSWVPLTPASAASAAR